MSGAEGGGIRNFGAMTLNDSSVSNNIASGIGGGIKNSGTLTLNRSTVSSNTANHDGGGIWNDGNLILNNSTVNGNTAPNPDGQYGLGGGIYSSRGILTLNNSTIQYLRQLWASGRLYWRVNRAQLGEVLENVRQ
jgi:hypothetical protein